MTENTAQSESRTFQTGDRVEHTGEGIRGEIVSDDYGGQLKVQWNDGQQTLETFHTLELVS